MKKNVFFKKSLIFSGLLMLWVDTYGKGVYFQEAEIFIKDAQGKTEFLKVPIAQEFLDEKFLEKIKKKAVFSCTDEFFPLSPKKFNPSAVQMEVCVQLPHWGTLSTAIPITYPSQIQKVLHRLKKGKFFRKLENTKKQDFSSRSHQIVITLMQPPQVTQSQLWILNSISTIGKWIYKIGTKLAIFFIGNPFFKILKNYVAKFLPRFSLLDFLFSPISMTGWVGDCLGRKVAQLGNLDKEWGGYVGKKVGQGAILYFFFSKFFKWIFSKLEVPGKKLKKFFLGQGDSKKGDGGDDEDKGDNGGNDRSKAPLSPSFSENSEKLSGKAKSFGCAGDSENSIVDVENAFLPAVVAVEGARSFADAPASQNHESNAPVSAKEPTTFSREHSLVSSTSSEASPPAPAFSPLVYAPLMHRFDLVSPTSYAGVQAIASSNVVPSSSSTMAVLESESVSDVEACSVASASEILENPSKDVEKTLKNEEKILNSTTTSVLKENLHPNAESENLTPQDLVSEKSAGWSALGTLGAAATATAVVVGSILSGASK